MCVESVAWISEQKNTLSTMFYLLAAIAYLNFDERRQWRSYAISSALFVMALLSKSMTATLPAALLVVFWWRRGQLSWRRDALPLIPWFSLGATVGLFTGWVERTVLGAEGAEFVFSPVDRILIAGRATWFYLVKLLWPSDLMFVYPRWRVEASVWWQFLFPLGVVALTVLLWKVRAWSRGPLACWLLFVIALFPILGFMNVYAFQYSFVADHWQYLASLRIFAIAAVGWTNLGKSLPVSGRMRRWQTIRPISTAAGLGVFGLHPGSPVTPIMTLRLLYRTILRRAQPVMLDGRVQPRNVSERPGTHSGSDCLLCAGSEDQA